MTTRDLGAESLGELARLALQRRGRQRIGGQIDEIAAVRDRRGDALGPRVGALERRRRARRGLVAVEAVAREQEAERRQFGAAAGGVAKR